MNDDDLLHLRRCLELAAEAVERGDQPFGSVLVSGDGTVLAERRNQIVTTGDLTAHPELALAGWASQHLDAAQRGAATMYTSGEHCTMCAAAHVRVGIGRLVYVLSAPMIAELAKPDVMINLRVTDIAAASNFGINTHKIEFNKSLDLVSDFDFVKSPDLSSDKFVILKVA